MDVVSFWQMRKIQRREADILSQVTQLVLQTEFWSRPSDSKSWIAAVLYAKQHAGLWGPKYDYSEFLTLGSSEHTESPQVIVTPAPLRELAVPAECLPFTCSNQLVPKCSESVEPIRLALGTFIKSRALAQTWLESQSLQVGQRCGYIKFSGDSFKNTAKTH